jgi:hypothetical protein
MKKLLILLSCVPSLILADGVTGGNNASSSYPKNGMFDTLNVGNGAAAMDGSGNLTCATIFSDSGQVNSDGSGDFYCGTFSTASQTYVDRYGNMNVGWNLAVSGYISAQGISYTSDRAKKELIQPLAPSNALAMALSLTNYSWQFRAQTNLLANVRANAAGLRGTNFVAQVMPPSGREFGPMAQDWHAVTGLGTGSNISTTAMSGLLLGAVQGLAAQNGILTNSSGAAFRLVVNDQTNGFLFVPQ